jgi:NYN domain
MDRCALFVDAGYVLADGAMAVHGTRHRESVSWNYAGLLQFLGSVARDRTGLPLLRCYWYEATVEGRRSSEHDALADLPGVKLRLGRMRPGRREGVESEIHRDLATLARNGALQDAVVVSAEEDLAQVIADVQDLGLRVTLMHITVDGNWTISRALRQECDEIVEVGEAHLRPYVELVMGAEPVRDDERHAAVPHQGRALTNGHGPVGPLGHQQALPPGSPAVPPEIYTAPVIAEYQRAAQPAANGQPGLPQPAAQDGPIGIAQPGQPQGQPGPPPAQAIQPQAQPGQPQAAPARQPRQPRNPRSRRQPQAGAAAPAADIQQGAVAAPSMPSQGTAAQQAVPAAPASQQAMPQAQPAAPAAQQTIPPQAMPAPQQAAPAAQPGMPPAQPGMPPAQQLAPAQQPGMPPAQPGMPPAQQAAPLPQRAMPPAQQAAAAPQQAMPPAHQAAPPLQQAAPPLQQAMPPAHQAAPPPQQAVPPPQQAMPPPQQAMPTAQPGQVLAAQNAGPTQMPAAAPQAGAAPGMAAQPGPQPQAQMPQPMPAPPAQPGPPYSGAPSAPASMPSAPHPGQPAPPGPMGQPAVPGQPGMPQPPVQQGQPGMAPYQAGPAGPGAQGMPAGQPAYPAPPAYQGPGPDAQAGPAGGPSPHGQAGPGQAMAGVQPSPPLASLPGPMPGQAPPGHALPPGAGDQAPLPAQPAQGGIRTQPAAAPAGRFARGPQDQRAAPQYPAPPADQPGGGAGPAYLPQQQDPYGGLQRAGYPPVPQQTSVSLADAVQAAHGEGFNFGQSVAREAPALWLEAVLARKPRMPSDLEARLLQDSALPIDSLLHDEVRHSLRRGFWDALERARH